MYKHMHKEHILHIKIFQAYYDGQSKEFSLQIVILNFSRHCNRSKAKEQIFIEFSIHCFMFFGFIFKDFLHLF